MLGILLTQACKDISKLDSATKEEIKVEATIKAEDFYSLKNEWMTQTFESLVQNGSAIKQLIGETSIQKSSVLNDGVIQIPINELNNKLMKKGSSSGDYEIVRVLTNDGEERYYTLLLEFVGNSNDGLNKQGTINIQDNSEVYLAWDYERFYAQEDENNEIIYPVIFPATNLTDPTKVISVSLYEDGTREIVSETSSMNKRTTTQNIDIVSLEPVEKGGGDSGPVETGTPSGPQGYHLIITSIKLSETGDSGSSELQLFIDANDDYTKSASKKIDYFFDKWYTLNGPKIDQKGSDNMYYKIVDVNAANFTYNFAGLEGGSPFSSANTTPANSAYWQMMPGFPIIELNSTYHRLFFADDDEVYDEFAVITSWELKRNISTYDFLTNTSSIIKHKIAANYEWTGSTDDPIKDGAARKINYNTMYSGISVQALTMYGSDGTTVTFGILSY